jgi:transcriptional regulator with XRE-family HTH domain
MDKADEIDKLVARRLRAARLGANMSQEDAAEKLGITFQQVQKFEFGFNRIKASQLAILAKAYQKPIEWFFPKDNITAPDVAAEFFALPHAHDLATGLLRRPGILPLLSRLVAVL